MIPFMVFLNSFGVSPYGGQYRECETIRVDTWKEASDMARAIIDGRDPKIKEGKVGMYFRNEEIIVYAKISPRKRTIYVE